MRGPGGWRGEGQRGAHGVEDAGANVGGGDAGEQARRGDDVVVHAAGLAAPGQRAREVVEQLIVAADPGRDVVDPGAVGELAAAEIREAGIKADRRGGEQVELPAHGSRLASGARRAELAEWRASRALVVLKIGGDDDPGSRGISSE